MSVSLWEVQAEQVAVAMQRMAIRHYRQQALLYQDALREYDALKADLRACRDRQNNQQ